MVNGRSVRFEEYLRAKLKTRLLRRKKKARDEINRRTEFGVIFVN